MFPSAAAEKRYHTDAEAPLPRIATRSPVSIVAPSVVPVAGNVVTAAEKASLDGAGQMNATAMRKSAPGGFSKKYLLTWIEYTLPGTTVNVIADTVALLVTRVRALTAVPVYAAISVSSPSPLKLSVTCMNNVRVHAIGVSNWPAVERQDTRAPT